MKVYRFKAIIEGELHSQQDEDLVVSGMPKACVDTERLEAVRFAIEGLMAQWPESISISIIESKEVKDGE